ncbi:MAG: UDP-glucose/GDP-mannose dehydrogenase family protein [Elusimicrobia bacterium]|nr:UDP-glucose/GDP-mannose dehydrogenase family protein [Elusimicrobiota bacterium]
MPGRSPSKSKKVGVIGCGYVGLVTGACFSKMGHDVFCVDNDSSKIDVLKKGKPPFFEPGLPELLTKAKRQGKLRFGSSIAEMMRHAEVVFICVGTPPRSDGSADLSAIEAVAREIARNLSHYTLIVEKSTVPVATGEQVARVIGGENSKNIPFDVASNPEFLREGTAIEDFFEPDRVVFGVNSPRAEKMLRELFSSVKAPVIVTDIKSAELIKHASNSFLATKIAYANALSRICDLIGADVTQVIKGVGMDKRIGRAFLNPGLVGGFCLPKDLEAFYHISKRMGYDFKLLQAVKEIHETQKDHVLNKLEEELWNLEGKTVAILGLSFKPNTDDLRFAPSLDIVKRLLSRGVLIRAYDPASMDKAKQILGNHTVSFAQDPYACLKGAHAAILVTEWDEFGGLDFARVKKEMALPVLIDVRNYWDSAKLKSLGFRYRGIGRN